MKRKSVVLLVSALVVVLGIYWTQHDNSTIAPNTNDQTGTTTAKPHSGQTAGSGFNKTKYSLTNPASIWVIVNKTHPMSPRNYVPTDLVLPHVTQRLPGRTEMKMRAPAARALEIMFAAAKQADVNLLISTAYRGYSYQKSLYDGYVATMGQAAADTTSARPGYSEHQTGLAVDIRAQSNKCPVEQCFGQMPEGKWLAANAYKYGFLLRYPADKQSVTGYEYEPWHFRYIGIDLSTELHNQGIETLEEFFGISGGTVYR